MAKAYYSVPPEYLGRELWARWDGHTVRIFNLRMEQIAFHFQQEPGRFATQSQHIASEKISGVERGAAWLLRRAALLGPHSQRWAEAMLHHRGVEGARVLQGLAPSGASSLSLSNRHENRQIERACELAQSHGAYRLRVLRDLIKRQSSQQDQGARPAWGFEFGQEHPIIRSLSEYGRFVHAVVQEDPLLPIQSNPAEFAEYCP